MSRGFVLEAICWGCMAAVGCLSLERNGLDMGGSTLRKTTSEDAVVAGGHVARRSAGINCARRGRGTAAVDPYDYALVLEGEGDDEGEEVRRERRVFCEGRCSAGVGVAHTFPCDGRTECYRQ